MKCGSADPKILSVKYVWRHRCGNPASGEEVGYGQGLDVWVVSNHRFS